MPISPTLAARTDTTSALGLRLVQQTDDLAPTADVSTTGELASLHRTKRTSSDAARFAARDIRLCEEQLDTCLKEYEEVCCELLELCCMPPGNLETAWFARINDTTGAISCRDPDTGTHEIINFRGSVQDIEKVSDLFRRHTLLAEQLASARSALSILNNFTQDNLLRSSDVPVITAGSGEDTTAAPPVMPAAEGHLELQVILA